MKDKSNRSGGGAPLEAPESGQKECRTLPRGYLIVAEGIDGAGKSTHCRLLGDFLEARGYPVVRLREPTGGPWGRKIRKILLEGRAGVTPEEELSYFINDRREDVERNILPALEAGRIVLLDRYYFSTAAYQGALGFDPDQIRRDNEAFAPRPDLVLYFYVAPEEGMERIRQSRDAPTSFEREDYLKKVKAIFDSFTDDNFKRIATNRPKEEVHAEVVREVMKLIDGKGDS